MTLVAVALALLAAILFAAASVAQHHVAAADSGGSLVGRLARSPLWWVGTFGDTAGFAMQAAALGVGSLLLVQPLLVTTLLFALPLGAGWAGRRVTRAEWGAALVLVASLAVFVVIGDPTAGLDRAPARDWMPTGTVLAVIVAGCVAVALLRRGTARALSLGVAAGMAFGVAAALVKGVVDLLGDGPVAVLTSWETWVLVLAVAGGTAAQQWSYSAGELSASLPAVTVGEPVVAAVIGLLVLGETIRADGPEWVLIGLTVAVMVAATISLARSSARPRAGSTSITTATGGPA
ncbi:MAG: DMT family transporter [Pseudonocardia sp.]|nr:DMT family transporter [Pseudonocardia sp.]